MPIQFNCPHCNRPYSVADAHAGKKFACKQCGKPVDVPGDPGSSGRVIPAPNTVRIAAAPPQASAPAKPAAEAAKPAPAKSAPAAKPGTGKLPKLPSKLKPMGQVKLPGKSKPKAE